MNLNIYSVRDLKASFGDVMMDVNDAVAMRNFQVACSRENTPLHVKGSDFELYRVGSFDTETGVITPEDKTLICVGKDML